MNKFYLWFGICLHRSRRYHINEWSSKSNANNPMLFDLNQTIKTCFWAFLGGGCWSSVKLTTAEQIVANFAVLFKYDFELKLVRPLLLLHTKIVLLRVLLTDLLRQCVWHSPTGALSEIENFVLKHISIFLHNSCLARIASYKAFVKYWIWIERCKPTKTNCRFTSMIHFNSCQRDVVPVFLASFRYSYISQISFHEGTLWIVRLIFI